ncbi:MAG: YbaB/EbfC family nucleoid-associated protein [Patescibacteria group bacterium]
MGMFDKLKDLNSMRQQAKQMQMQLAQVQVTGQSNDAMIRLIMDGNQDIKSVEVMDGVVGDRKKIAQDIREALHDLNENFKKMMQEKYGNMFQ